MKAEILKIAGVKNEAEFYKLFPDEASFMKKHGKELNALKKAQAGAQVKGTAGPTRINTQFDPETGTYVPATTGAPINELGSVVGQQTSIFDLNQIEKKRRQQEALGNAMKQVTSVAGSFGKHGVEIPMAQFGETTGDPMLGTPTPTGMNVIYDPVTGTYKPPKYAQQGPTIPQYGKSQYTGFGKNYGNQFAPAYQPQPMPQQDFSSGAMAQQYFPKMGTSTQTPNYAGQWAQNNPMPTGTTNAATTGSGMKGSGGKGMGGGSTSYGGIAEGAMQMIQGFKALKEEKKQVKRARQTEKLAGLMLSSSQVTDVDAPRQFRETQQKRNKALMPVTTGEEMFPVYGVGTNVLSKHGGTYGKLNPIYDFDPVDDEYMIKSYQSGGSTGGGGGFNWQAMMGQMGGQQGGQQGGGGQAAGMGSGIASPLIYSAYDYNAGSQIGGGAGKAIGSIWGPVGGMIGEAAGAAIGGAFDKNPRRIKSAMAHAKQSSETTMMNQFGKNFQDAYGAYVEHGGTISAYRSGGHMSDSNYIPVSEHGMEIYRGGGDIKTHWGGGYEPISRNPYLPEDGETIMFRGNSHDTRDRNGRTGIGVSYGHAQDGATMQGANVEVEGGEPAVKLPNEEGDTDLTVFGDLKIPKFASTILGKDASGKRFKNYIAELSKEENKYNKIADKSAESINDLKLINSFDKVEGASHHANIVGANMRLKEIADKKQKAAALQDSINQQAEELGIDPGKMLKGKLERVEEPDMIAAKKGATVAKANPPKGKKMTKARARADVPLQHRDPTGTYGGVSHRQLIQMQKNNPWYDWDNFDPSSEADVLDFQQQFNKTAEAVGSPARLKEDKRLGQQTASAAVDYEGGEETPTPTPAATADKAPVFDVKPNKRSKLIDIANMAIPLLRKSDAEDYDVRNSMAELYTLATEKADPVQMQLYHPELDIPYDISLQDQLNENEATYRAGLRVAANNPAAIAQLNAQKYDANSKVLGEQFRMNQALKDKVYSGNRATLNQAQQVNLGIMDQQYVRQQQAIANTRRNIFDALSSMNTKELQHNLENKTLKIYENMYNYRYDASGRAINMNPLYRPDMPVFYDKGAEIPTHLPQKDANGNTVMVPNPDYTGPATNPEKPPMAGTSYVTPGYTAPANSTYTPLQAPTATVPGQRYGGKVDKQKSSIVRMFK